MNSTTSSNKDGLDALLALPTKPADEFANWMAKQLNDLPDDVAATTAHKASFTQALSEVELRYLRCVLEQQGKPSTEYAKLAKIGHKRAQRIRQHLFELGYLRERNVNTSQDGRGRMSIMLEPLEPAFTILQQGGKDE